MTTNNIVPIETRVLQIIAELAGAEVVTRAAKLAADLLFDSLDHGEVALNLEDEFDIRLDDETLGACVTAGDVIDAVTRAIEQKQGSAS